MNMSVYYGARQMKVFLPASSIDPDEVQAYINSFESDPAMDEPTRASLPGTGIRCTGTASSLMMTNISNLSLHLSSRSRTLKTRHRSAGILLR